MDAWELLAGSVQEEVVEKEEDKIELVEEKKDITNNELVEEEDNSVLILPEETPKKIQTDNFYGFNCYDFSWL